jgi:UDP-N-acetylmuramyl pentapeptide phosphotransferase/UDP-N-acetylglucosamine-1-phosphate transferase
MPVIIHTARERGLFEANDERKTHLEQVSSFGGIGIIAAFSIPILLLIYSGTNKAVAAFGLAIPLFLISLLDDIFGLRVTYRFIVHALLGSTLYLMGFSVLDLSSYPIFDAVSTIVFTILLINAYNLIDGINGLAGGLGIISAVVFGMALAQQGQHDMALACFSFAGALLGYLNFNFGKKALIFMGDNGSTVLGYLTAIMALAFLNSDATNGAIVYNYALVLAVVSVPVADVFKVAIMRFLKGKSPFRPDRTHIHHLYTDKLLTHPTACLLLYGWTLTQVALAILLPSAYSFQTIGILTIVPYLFVKALRSTKELLESPGARWRVDRDNG